MTSYSGGQTDTLQQLVTTRRQETKEQLESEFQDLLARYHRAEIMKAQPLLKQYTKDLQEFVARYPGFAQRARSFVKKTD